MLDGYRLMIPGPIQVTSEILAELSRPIVPHYGEEWTAFYNETLGLLKRVFRTEGEIFAIPGSGSAALDAAIGSSLGPSDRLLVLSNGFFGDRISEIAQSYQPGACVVRLPVDRPIGHQDLADALDAEQDITAVMVVHSESSSGLLNPVRELAQICRERGLLFLVDAVSSLGGIELEMDAWGIDLCISASQKCLGGPPGLGLVAVGPRGWARIRDKATPGWYLNLHTWHKYAEMWSDWHPYPITMAVPILRALRAGLEDVLREGLEARARRHRDMAVWVRGQLESRGYRPVFSPDVATPTVLAFYPPDGLAAAEIVEALRARYRVLVGGGMGDFKGKAFRIGNMGRQATLAEMKPLVEALGELATEGKERIADG